MRAPDLVVLGNLLVDDVVLGDGRTRMAEPGGATLYAALGARLFGMAVGVVSWRGDDYPAWALEALVEQGIDLAGVHDLGRPGVRTWLLYEEGRRQILHRLGRPSHAEVSPGPDQIPSSWRNARAFHLAPMPLDLQKAVVEALTREAFVSLDPHVPLRADTLEAWGGVLQNVDALFLGEDETALPEDAIRGLARGRLRLLIHKRGARGGRLYDACAGGSLDWAARAEHVVDPTGAGDAFAGGFLAGWLRGDPAERALQVGVVAASFAVEDWGAAGLLDATADQAEDRLRAWFGG